MRKGSAVFVMGVSLLALAVTLSGCTIIFQKGRRKDVEKITKLQSQYSALKDEVSELERAKRELENRLRGEIDNESVKVEMLERGLVITFVAEVLFDSGKANLKSQSLHTLDEVAQVLNTTVRDLNVGIEGHTDNEPIRKSGWKSNWELSAARAMSVLHYLSDQHGIDPTRLSGTGFGEYHPVASNDAKEGRQKNRRVEIVILPKVSKEAAVIESENLK